MQDAAILSVMYSSRYGSIPAHPPQFEAGRTFAQTVVYMPGVGRIRLDESARERELSRIYGRPIAVRLGDIDTADHITVFPNFELVIIRKFQPIDSVWI
jgi:hypothetical protein